MSEVIDIKGLDKAEVLAALFNSSRQQGMGFLDFSGAKPMTVDEARLLTVENYPYYDYLRGRVMKINILGDELDPRLYDRDNGQGAAARALQPLLSKVAS